MHIQLGCLEIDFKCVERWRLVPGFRDCREVEQVSPTPQHQGTLERKDRCLLASFSMTDSQQVTMSVSYADKKGNPTSPPPGAQPPTWLVDTPALLAVAPAADGLSCIVAAVGPLGDGTVSVKVTNAAGDPLATGSIAVTIVSGAPSVVSVTPGAPTEQP